MEIYLVMAKSRVRGTENWETPNVVFADRTRKTAEKDTDNLNKMQNENDFLEFNYYVEECLLY